MRPKFHCQVLTLNNELPEVKSIYTRYKDSLPKTKQSDLVALSRTCNAQTQKQISIKHSAFVSSKASNTKTSFSEKLSLNTTRSAIKSKLNQNYGTSTRSLMNSFKKKLTLKRIKTNDVLSKLLGYPGNENDWLKASVGKLKYKTLYY